MTVVLALLPAVAVFAAMGLVPVLILLALLLALRAADVRATLAAEGRVFWIILLVLVLWPLLSALWSITPSASLSYGARLAALMGVGAVAFTLVRAQTFNARMLLPMVSGVAVCALLLETELVPGGGLISLAYHAMGLDFERFIDKNINRGLCALVILVWPAVMSVRTSRYARLAWVLPVMVAVPVFGMQSQSAQLALGVSSIAYVAVWAVPKSMPRVLAIAVPLLIAVWPLVFPVLDKIVFTQPSVYEALPSTAQHRVEIWRFVTERISERPALGWGLESSRALPGGDVVYAGERKYLPLHPHNSALQVVLELGSVGFALFVAALAAALHRWARMVDIPTHSQAAAAAVIIGYLSIGFTAFGVWQYWWLALGWLGAMVWRAGGQK